MSVLISAFVLGIACGLRAVVGLAAVSWAANSQQLPLQGTWLSFLGNRLRQRRDLSQLRTRSVRT
jgi:uncharacterized membrane protein